MKKCAQFISLLLMCLYTHANLYGQDDKRRSRIDSLTKALPQVKGDSQKVKILHTLSHALNEVDPQKGLLYGKECLRLADALKWSAKTGTAYNDIGECYHFLGDNTNALDNYLKALTVFENQRDSLHMGIVYGNISYVYEDLNNLPKVLECDSTSLKIANSINDTEGVADNLIRLAGTFISIQNYTEAIKALTYELTVAKSMHSKQYELDGLGQLGLAYQQKGNYASALPYFFKAISLSREIGDEANEAVITGLAGDTYHLIAADTIQKIVADSLIPASRKENLKKAKQLLSRAIALSTEISDVRDAMLYTQDMSQINELEGDYKSALENFKKFAEYYDSSISKDVRVNVSALETKREQQLKEKQIELNKLAIKQERRERVLFIIGLVMLVIVIAVVYNNYKNQKKTSQLRAASLQQKDMLMKEIHHRVKNNLQVISTLLELQLVNITDDHAKGAITESTTRLKAISLIHQQLYQDEHITTIECSQFAKDLYAQISSVFNKPGQQVTFNNNIPNTILDIDTAVPIGLILNELMTNSYKYAFDGANGSIGVNIDKDANVYVLTYTDSGPGLPDGLNVKSIKSLGMKIITRLSKQLGGTFHYEKEANRFVITFMDIEGRKMID